MVLSGVALRQRAGGSRPPLRSTPAFSGAAMNFTIAAAASRSFETASTPDGEMIVLLQLRRQRPGELGARDRQDHVDLLHRDLDLAARHRLGGREAVEELRARLQLLGEPEVLMMLATIRPEPAVE